MEDRHDVVSVHGQVLNRKGLFSLENRVDACPKLLEIMRKSGLAAVPDVVRDSEIEEVRDVLPADGPDESTDRGVRPFATVVEHVVPYEVTHRLRHLTTETEPGHRLFRHRRAHELVVVEGRL